jgi:1-acyl-sn-glycerol-3-phosphate acyltransferase
MVVSAIFAMLLLGSVGLTIPELFLVTAILNLVVAIYVFTIVPEFFIRFLIWILIHTIYRLDIRGIEHIPDHGPVIIASNHVSFVDPLIIGGIIRRPVRFLMYYRIFQIRMLKWFFKFGRAIPIAGKHEDAQIFEQANQRSVEVLDEGDVLGIFPEGGITTTGDIGTFKKGIEHIVDRRPVVVVPIALCNLWGSLFSRRDPLYKRRPYKFRARIEIRIGKPVPVEELTASHLEDTIRQLRGDDR